VVPIYPFLSYSWAFVPSLLWGIRLHLVLGIRPYLLIGHSSPSPYGHSSLPPYRAFVPILLGIRPYLIGRLSLPYWASVPSFYRASVPIRVILLGVRSTLPQGIHSHHLLGALPLSDDIPFLASDISRGRSQHLTPIIYLIHTLIHLFTPFFSSDRSCTSWDTGWYTRYC
jgi:hypothetical protein